MCQPKPGRDTTLHYFLDSAKNPTFSIGNSPTTFAVVLFPFEGFGCPDTVYTKVLPSHLVTHPLNKVIFCYNSSNSFLLIANAKDNFSPLTYLWQGTSPLNCYTCESNIIYPSESATYTVLIKDTFGCKHLDTIMITVDTCEIWFPSAFTPNGDGKNDIIKVLGQLSPYQDFSLSIYNRWGQRVFYTEDKYKGWNGIFNGVKQEIDTYSYMILYKLHGQSGIMKGNFELIR